MPHSRLPGGLLPRANSLASIILAFRTAAVARQMRFSIAESLGGFPRVEKSYPVFFATAFYTSFPLPETTEALHLMANFFTEKLAH